MGSSKKAKYRVPRSNNQRKKKRRRRRKASNVNPMEQVPGDVLMTESTQQNLDGSAAAAGKPVEKLSQNTMDRIIDAVMNHLAVTQEDSVLPRHHHNQEMLAQGVTATVMEGPPMAIDGCCTGHLPKAVFTLSISDQSDLAIDTQCSAHCCQSDLVQSGLSPMGSVDMPEAPPPTPLSPALEKGRDSFARKLKGVLAKVFLPSPPPPTPMDGQGELASGLDDHQGELMEHLMRSLPKNDSPGLDGVDQGHLEDNFEGFAEGLSSSIVTSALQTNS